MSEPKGPFDAAIRILKTTEIDVGEANEVRDAIHVLEAAGRYAENPCSDTAADLIEEVGKHGKV